MKKKAFLFLLLLPFVIAILAFVTASYVIRSVEVNITSILLPYDGEVGFLLRDGKQLLKAEAIYDKNYPLSEGNLLVWSSSDESVAEILKEGEDYYLVPKKEGESIITCSTVKGSTSPASFTAKIFGDSGGIIVNPTIPFSQSHIENRNYVGLYDSKEAYDSRSEERVNSDAKLEFNIDIIGTSLTLDGINIETSSNVSFDKTSKTASFLGSGEAYINFIHPFSSTGGASFNFTLVEGVNAYSYDDLISLTNKANKPYKIVLRTNLESYANTYNFDEDGNIIGTKSKNTSLFGRIDENNEISDFKDDLYTFETTYNHDFLNKWNAEIDKGGHEGEEKTSIMRYAGLHIQDDFYGNGFTINLHELTYPSGRQNVTIDGETYLVPYLEKDDLYRGPLPFVTLGNPNYSMSDTLPMFTLYGQDNSGVYIDSDNVTINDVHFKNCDFGNNLSNLEYVGSTLDINADNVTIKNSIIENGKNVIRSYSSKNLLIENSLIQNAMEFLFRSGSNEFNHVNYDERVEYSGENGQRLSSTKSSYLEPITSNYSQKTYKADSMLTFSAILNTQAGEFLNISGPNYTKEEYITFKDTLINALTNRNGFEDENNNKVYAGTTKIVHTNFASSGISAISLDTLPQGSFLETNITSVFKMLLGVYMSDAYPEKMALTSFPTKVEIGEGVNFYDWKDVNQLTYESLVGQDIETLIVSHGGLGSDFEVNITEEDYLPLKKLLLDNYSNSLLKDNKINLPFYIEGGGYNESELVLNEELKSYLTPLLEVDPFAYSLDLKAYHSNDFNRDPKAKYETMKVAMLRASFNVIGFNNYKFYGLDSSKAKWFNEAPSLDYLKNYENINNL